MRRALLAGSIVLVLCGFFTPGTSDRADTLTPSVTTAAQHQLIPAYFYPAGSDATNPWHVMCRAMNRSHGGSIAIVSPDSGPGTFRNPPFVKAIAFCHQHGQKVIGYVSTDYATRPLAQTLHDVDLYYRYYKVDGIFLDEMSNFSTTVVAKGMTVENYYRHVYNRIKSKTGRGRYVVGNPGAPASTSWQLTAPVADKVVVFEDTAEVYLQRTPPAWVKQQPPNRIGALIKRTSAPERHQICALSRTRNAGWVDVTDDGPPNTWDTLPPYWPLVAPGCK